MRDRQSTIIKMHKDERFQCKTDHLIFLVLWFSQFWTTEFNALRFQCSCQIQLKIAIIGLSFSTRGKRKSFSPSRSSWLPHNKGGKRRKSFLQFCFSSQCLGNAFTSGCLLSWMENITSWTAKKKKSKMQAHVTVFLVYCGYRGRGTKKYHWKCALTLYKTTMGLLLIITEVSPYWKIQTKFSCVHTS